MKNFENKEYYYSGFKHAFKAERRVFKNTKYRDLQDIGFLLSKGARV